MNDYLASLPRYVPEQLVRNPSSAQQPSQQSDDLKTIPYGTACPVCGHKDGWCGWFENNHCVVICMRVESDRPTRNDGWLHIRGDTRRPYTRCESIPIEPVQYDSPPGITERYRQYRANATPELKQLASKYLQVSDLSLDRLGLGLRLQDSRYPYGAFVWPMWGPAGELIGLKFRDPVTREKRTSQGGHNGLFIPRGLDIAGGQMLVCEGVTDTAAALELQYHAIGRDGCSGLHRHIQDFVRIQKPGEIIIVADGDEPGRRGAQRLAGALVPLVRSVRVIAPPTGIKDLRQWFVAGATRFDVEKIIQQTRVVRVCVI